MPEKTPENTEINSPTSSKIPTEFISQITSLCDEWDKTESWIKQGELISKKAIAPSINEMRYAGRQMVDACRHVASNNSNTNKHLSEAHATLLRARHDVVDSIFTYISDNANNHRNRLGSGNLQKNFSNYENFFSLLKTLGDKTFLSRENRNLRDKIYGEIMKNDMPNLINFHNALEESLHAIEQNIRKENFFTSLKIVGAVGVVYTIGMVIVSFVQSLF